VAVKATMAQSKNLLSEMTGEFELPQAGDGTNPNRKEVSWSATPKENEQEMVEIRKMPIEYKLANHLSAKTVMKETHTMFKATDKDFLLVSKEDSTDIIKTAADIDRLLSEEKKKYFPVDLVRSSTVIKMFVVATMPISRLKRATFGYYKYAAKSIWIVEDPFQSSDVHNIGFIIQKDPNEISRDLFAQQLYERLTESSSFTDANVDRYNVAKEALPFDSPLPKFQLRVSSHIYHNGIQGKVKTTAITIHCDHKHCEFMTKLFTGYYEASTTDERFVPHSLLHGNDAIHQKAYRTAIIIQNKYLTKVRVIPVIGLSATESDERNVKNWTTTRADRDETIE
jgi:hypothetical protein